MTKKQNDYGWLVNDGHVWLNKKKEIFFFVLFNKNIAEMNILLKIIYALAPFILVTKKVSVN